jgi:hypothetical protein
MSVFLLKSDLPIETQKKIDAIEAIPVANRTDPQTDFLTALLPYLTNSVISVDENGLILVASGLTVPTGAEGFSKGASFIKTDATGNGLYMNTADETSSAWDLVDQASTTNIDDKAVTLPKMADMATSSLIYRKTAAAGVPEVNSLATLKTDLGLTGTNSGDNYLDDVSLTLGTTTATPATKVSLSFDKTANNIGKLVMGTSAVPQIVSASADSLLKAREVCLTANGATTCDDLLADYKKLNITGAGDSGLTPVTDRAVLNVGLTGGANNSAIAEGYVRQDTLTHGGTGTTAALSAHSIKLDVGAEAFIATNNAEVAHFFLRGAGAVTSTDYNGVMIDIGGEVVNLKSGLHLAIGNNAATAHGLLITGTPVSQVTLGTGAKIFSGSAADEAAVYAAVGTADAIGSLYISTGGKLFIQVANGGAATDWDLVTATHV